MGTVRKGVLGGFSGTVGTVIGANWKGIAYMRSLATLKKNPTFSDAQLKQQLRFGLAVGFLRSMKPVLEITFREFADQMTGFNYALKQIMQKAVIGEYPDFKIDFSQVELSRGSLAKPNNPVARATVAGQIDFSWRDNSAVGTAKETDKAIFVAYCPSLAQSIYTLAGSDRAAKSGTLDVSSFSGLEVETYMAYVSANGKKSADSIYTGKLSVL